MKKLFVLLLAVMVMSSLALVAVACGDDTDAELDEALEELDEALEDLDALDEELDEAMDEMDEAVDDADADSDVLTPAQGVALGDEVLADYEAAGKPDDKTGFASDEVTVGGPVSGVKDKGTFVIVNVGDDTAAINVLVPYDVFEAAGLTLDDLSAWVGQDVEVTGSFVVNDWGSLAEIQITDLSQISLPM